MTNAARRKKQKKKRRREMKRKVASNKSKEKKKKKKKRIVAIKSFNDFFSPVFPVFPRRTAAHEKKMCTLNTLTCVRIKRRGERKKRDKKRKVWICNSERMLTEEISVA